MGAEVPAGFKGLWISSALCGNHNLNWSERAVAAEIDALTTKKGPCMASNQHLAKMAGLSQVRTEAILGKLQSTGIIQRLGFHRAFVARVVSPEYAKDPLLCDRLISARVIENNNPKRSRVIENDDPENSRVIENDSRGLSKTIVEGYRFQGTEILLENSKENSKIKSGTHSRPRPTKVAPLKDGASRNGAADHPSTPRQKKKCVQPSLSELTAYCASIDIPEEAPHIEDHWKANGFKAGKNPMVDWQAAVRNWKRRKTQFAQNGHTNNQPTDEDAQQVRDLIESSQHDE